MQSVAPVTPVKKNRATGQESAPRSASQALGSALAMYAADVRRAGLTPKPSPLNKQFADRLVHNPVHVLPVCWRTELRACVLAEQARKREMEQEASSKENIRFNGATKTSTVLKSAPTASETTATKPTATKPTATKPTATKPTATKPTATKPGAPAAAVPAAIPATATESAAAGHVEVVSSGPANVTDGACVGVITTREVSPIVNMALGVALVLIQVPIGISAAILNAVLALRGNH
jgi:hypothetical protein